jgi:hypothetical protein
MSYRTPWRIGALAAVLLLVVGACSTDDSSSATSEANEPETTATATTPPDTEAPPGEDTVPTGSTESVYEPGTIDPGLQPFIDRAVADLAKRLGIGVDEIETISGVLVVWPDSSLGCPQPGMVYTPATEDGSVIELGAQGRVFRYHTGGTTYEPFLCDQPLKEAPSAVDSGGISDDA